MRGDEQEIKSRRVRAARAGDPKSSDEWGVTNDEPKTESWRVKATAADN